MINRAGKRGSAKSIWYYKNDDFIAVDAINDPASFAIGKRILQNGKTLPKDADL